MEAGDAERALAGSTEACNLAPTRRAALPTLVLRGQSLSRLDLIFRRFQNM